MTVSLRRLWELQATYNEKIREIERETSLDVWTQTYLLGLVSEVDEVLDSVKWKRHRKSSSQPDKTNLALELADLTKYIISLWQIWGFTYEDMLDFCTQKSEMLSELLRQEQEEIPPDRLIVISDLDGTLGNWRKSFLDWAKDRSENILIDDPSLSLLMDTDLELNYPEYYALKEEFERTGEYLNIYPYSDSIAAIRRLIAEENIYLIVSTARPISQYKRIWLDTWRWLMRNNVQADKLLFYADTRVLLADSLLRKACKVIMFEDDPGIIVRAAKSGVRVFVKKQPYNKEIVHENVTIVDDFSELSVQDFTT